METKNSSRLVRILKFIRPIVIAAGVTILAFFLLQGIPVARTLYRRTDLVSARVVQNGQEKRLTEQEEVVRAAEVAGMLARRFSANVCGGPDTYYVYTFEDGTELTVGVLDNNIFYDGKWYQGAASTPELFRNLTASRFFAEE